MQKLSEGAYVPDIEKEVFFDINCTVPAAGEELFATLTKLCAGAVIVWISATEIMSEIRKFSNQRNQLRIVKNED